MEKLKSQIIRNKDPLIADSGLTTRVQTMPIRLRVETKTRFQESAHRKWCRNHSQRSKANLKTMTPKATKDRQLGAPEVEIRQKSNTTRIGRKNKMIMIQIDLKISGKGEESLIKSKRTGKSSVIRAT